MATLFTGSPEDDLSRPGQFNRKLSYDRLRCRLNTPAPAPPADCGPLQQTQVTATPMVTGPVTEGSPESDPPG